MNWLALTQSPVLNTGDIHIIRYWISEQNPHYEQSWQVLTDEEKTNCQRFRFIKDKVQHVLARGLLRIFINRYTNIAPEQINFFITKYGKLALAETIDNNLTFNISHSGSVILFAFSRIVPLGVDIEYTKRTTDLLGLAQRFFAQDEYDKLSSLKQEQQTTGFYNAWTRKEAFIKAIGEGLSHPLDSFSVTLKPDEPVALIRSVHLGEQLKNWSLHHLDVYKEYIAALAVPIAKPVLSLFEFK